MNRDVFAAMPHGVVPSRVGVVGVTEARRTALTALQGLSPPEELRPEHLLLVQAIQDLVVASEVFLTSTADLDHDEFTAALLASVEIDPLAAAFGAACVTWHRRATELGHQVGLPC